MPITRKTTTTVEEFYDSSIDSGPTESPISPKFNPESQTGTGLTPATESSSADEVSSRHTSPPSGYSKTGRTFPDMFMESMNDARLTAVVLLFIPVIFWVDNIKGIKDLYIPFLVGVVLNAVWFIVVPLIQWLKAMITRS